ncbi:MAG: helix-turn-helix domain-containing protein [Actinomycetota bacterium]
MIHHVTEPVTAPELSIDALLAAAAGHGAFAGARKLLSPIVAHDRKHSGHRLDTLKTYLDSDCQPSLACEKLFIHRNTLAQRLRKLESLLRLRLDTLEGQMTCLMAVRLTEGRGARSKMEAKTGVQPPVSN